eukprot:7517499-Pyramimonas_sp.AAC.1
MNKLEQPNTTHSQKTMGSIWPHMGGIHVSAQVHRCYGAETCEEHKHTLEECGRNASQTVTALRSQSSQRA